MDEWLKWLKEQQHFVPFTVTSNAVRNRTEGDSYRVGGWSNHKKVEDLLLEEGTKIHGENNYQMVVLYLTNDIPKLNADYHLSCVELTKGPGIYSSRDEKGNYHIEELYPNAHCELNYTKDYELLIAIVLYLLGYAVVEIRIKIKNMLKDAE